MVLVDYIGIFFTFPNTFDRWLFIYPAQNLLPPPRGEQGLTGFTWLTEEVQHNCRKSNCRKWKKKIAGNEFFVVVGNEVHIAGNEMQRFETCTHIYNQKSLIMQMHFFGGGHQSSSWQSPTCRHLSNKVLSSTPREIIL